MTREPDILAKTLARLKKEFDDVTDDEFLAAVEDFNLAYVEEKQMRLRLSEPRGCSVMDE